MRRRKEIEKIFSAKKCTYNIYSKNKKKFYELKYAYCQNTVDLRNHKLAYICYFRKNIYKLCDPAINLDYLFYRTRRLRIYIYKLNKLNLLLQSLSTFKYKRMLYILTQLPKYLNFNRNVFSNTYSNLFLLKSVFSRNYDLCSNQFANNTLFYEEAIDHNNQFEDSYYFDKIYDYYCKHFFFERFNCITFNTSCFDPSVNVVMSASDHTFISEDNINCNNSYDFFFFKIKDIQHKNYYLASNMLLFPRNRDEFIDSSLGFSEDEVADQNLFFSKYRVISDYYIFFNPYIISDDFHFSYPDNHMFHIYKFLNFFFFLKLFN